MPFKPFCKEITSLFAYSHCISSAIFLKNKEAISFNVFCMLVKHWIWSDMKSCHVIHGSKSKSQWVSQSTPRTKSIAIRNCHCVIFSPQKSENTSNFQNIEKCYNPIFSLEYKINLSALKEIYIFYCFIRNCIVQI